tara:strand:+ start:2728 stop:3627 length:900 start_codon:yes stop_codon:yes gene_type:complete
MSILNVNQIQPVGGGNTITVNASDVSASGVTITASNFVGPVAGNVTGNVTGNLTGNLTGNVTGNVTSSSTSTFSSGINVTGGSVGIGTDNPGAKLEVRDNASQGIIIRSLSTQATNTNKALRIRNNSNTDTFSVSHKGELTLAENIVIASGKGIDFSAAGNAGGMQSELLDDYEEGTYSASITMGTSGTVTMNSSYDTLSYTKIGRMVYVTGQIRVSSVSSPVGGTLINLPFAVRNNISDARGGGTVTLYINGQAHYYWPLVYQIAESTSKINLTHNATGYFLPAAGNEYAISIMYIVT